MAKKTRLQLLRKEADRHYQLGIKTHNPKCLVCGRPTQVVHHYVPKSLSNRLRYDLKNGIPLDNGCHMKHHQAGDPNIQSTIERRKGVEWIEYINKARREFVKTDTAFYEEARDRLKKYAESDMDSRDSSLITERRLT